MRNFQKYLMAFILALTISKSLAQVTIQEIGILPEAVSNNAVCEGFIDDKSYLFSFGGLDQSKSYEGIHLRSFRYDIENDISIQLPDLPDTLGKIAAGASRIGDIIYIIGGYHVLEDDSEISSDKVHRYDILNNQFLTDGQNIPIPIDDHVQAIWNDSLIYIITGWSTIENVPNVQIYNPTSDSWTMGTPLPPNHEYSAFGSSGQIIDNTIYFFGGANGSTFAPQFRMRKGIINPTDVTQIEWSISAPDWTKKSYRAASTTVGNAIYWIGGSENTYNYDGIAYDQSGGVSPTNRVLYNTKDNLETGFQEIILSEIPMDLRGIADVNETHKYLLGGMLSNQEVTNKVYEIIIDPISTSNFERKEEISFALFPNPTNDILHIKSAWQDNVTIQILDVLGVAIWQQTKFLNTETSINVEFLPAGSYSVIIQKDGKQFNQRLVIAR